MEGNGTRKRKRHIESSRVDSREGRRTLVRFHFRNHQHSPLGLGLRPEDVTLALFIVFDASKPPKRFFQPVFSIGRLTLRRKKVLDDMIAKT